MLREHMYRVACSCLLALAFAALAEPVHFGRPFSLTNTHYDNVNPRAKLITNGHDPFLVWSYGWFVTRMNPVIEGESRIGQPIGGGVVVWTGRHFVVVGRTESSVLDTRGEPTGTRSRHEFRGSPVSIATNGENAVIVTLEPEALVSVLTTDGVFVESQKEFLEFGDWSESAIASNGSEYCVLTASDEGVRATMLDRSGKTLSRRWIDESAQRRSAPVAIASNGRNYLALWNDGAVKGCLIEPDGSVSAGPFIVAQAASGETIEATSAAWTGDRYAVAYGRRSPTQDSGAQIMFVEAGPRIVTGPALAGSAPFAPGPSLVLASGRLFASWATEQGMVVRDVAREGDQPIPAAWAARLQAAPLAISSADATLVVWLEVHDQTGGWRMGLRGVDGSWREQDLPPGSTQSQPRIGSDGRDFLIVRDTEAMRFDRNGSLLQPVTALPFQPSGVAWNGSDYILAARTKTQDIVAARLSASGALSSTTIARQGNSSIGVGDPHVASDGAGNALIVWPEELYPVQPVGFDPEIYATFLDDPSRKRILVDSHTDFFHSSKGVAWDGAQYVVAYATEQNPGVFVRRVSPAGVVESDRITLSGATAYETTIARAGDGVAVAWTAWSSPQSRCCTDYLSVVDRTGAVFPAGNYPRNPLFDPRSYAVTSLPGGRLAYLGVPTNHDLPHYGSDRLVMAISEPGAAPSIADAPAISVERDGQSARVTWSAPPQPVNGYRVEYKAGNGEWTELERWFTAQERVVRVVLSSRTTISWRFRMRAWSDGGTSAYSNEAVVPLPRRRSVR